MTLNSLVKQGCPELRIFIKDRGKKAMKCLAITKENNEGFKTQPSWVQDESANCSLPSSVRTGG
jgi:hypothetical protein